MHQKTAEYYLYHYGQEVPTKIIMDYDMLERESSLLALVEGVYRYLPRDPVIAIRVCGNETKITGGDIDIVDIDMSSIAIRWDTLDHQAEQRRYKRYPVSCHCDIRVFETKKRILGLIKDVSDYGFRIYSKDIILPQQHVEVCIFRGSKTHFIDAAVVKQITVMDDHIYGLMVDYRDVLSVRNLQSFIKAYQEDCLRNIDIRLLDYYKTLKYKFEVADLEKYDMEKRLETAVDQLNKKIQKQR